MSEAPKTVLALDTATPYLTLGLHWREGELEYSAQLGRAHAEQLAQAVQRLFAQAVLPFKAQLIVIGTGPGSYTGVRIGASYALGLAQAWGCPILGVSTLCSLVQGEGLQAVSLDARKGQRYSAVYEVSTGVMQKVVQPVAKRSLDALAQLAQGLPHHQDPVPSGLSLLRAGLEHGNEHWALQYL